MKQEYVIYFRDAALAPMLDSLKKAIPEAKILSRRGAVALVEVPIHSEAVFIAYFADADCTVSKNHTYTLQAEPK